MLKDYLKGPMRPSEMGKLRKVKPGKAAKAKAATAAKSDSEGSSAIATYLPYLIPLAMLVSALYFHFFSGKSAAADGQTEL